ncbi:hypothetical protein J4444_02075 [Candidatus Woesearchaeota archaeon]|nr:hypothetical protein [Candidatus Woesearchaeota archaeon]
MPETLPQIVERMRVVYLDNSIMDRDSNYVKSIEPNPKNQPTSFKEIIINEMRRRRSLNHTAIDVLLKQEVYAHQICDLVKANNHIQTVPSIVEEYRAYVDILRNFNNGLNWNNGVPSRNESSLKRIVEYHQQILTLLKQRDTSYADAELVARSLEFTAENADDAAIITGDLDIVNLVRNFAEFDYSRGLPIEFKDLSLQGTVSVYFPSRERWRPDLEVDLLYKTPPGKKKFVIDMNEVNEALRRLTSGK